MNLSAMVNPHHDDRDVVDLLYGDAAPAKAIAAKPPRYTKEEYCKLVESFDKTEHFSFGQ